jgi:hypothetical protein
MLYALESPSNPLTFTTPQKLAILVFTLLMLMLGGLFPGACTWQHGLIDGGLLLDVSVVICGYVRLGQQLVLVAGGYIAGSVSELGS